MVGMPSFKIKFTEKHKKILRDLAITETAPGSILHDFGVLVDIVRKAPFTLTPTYQLPMKILKPLNERLARPLQIGLKRPQQKSYPHIHGLYLLLRTSGLVLTSTAGKNPSLILDDASYTHWMELNPTEKYFTLIEAWFMRGYEEIIGESGNAYWHVPTHLDNIRSFVDYCNLHKEKPVQVTADMKSVLTYLIGGYNLGLLEMFGWLTIETAPPADDGRWNIKSLQLTPIGSAFLGVFFVQMRSILEEILSRTEVLPAGDTTQDIFQPYFPELHNTFIPPDPPFQEGMHLFKVGLSAEIWRRIAIDAHQTFDDLATAILQSVDFDDSYFYRFGYANRFGGLDDISHPNLQEESQGDEVKIGEIGLGIGESMVFRFDFGVNWKFILFLEAIDPAQQLEGYEIRESRGEVPEQYFFGDYGFAIMDIDDSDDSDLYLDG